MMVENLWIVKGLKRWEFYIFYAHSHCSGKRRSNENKNKLIRRFLPKERDFKKVMEKEIKQLEKYINEYRRKLFGEKNQEKYLKWSIQNMKINDTL